MTKYPRYKLAFSLERMRKCIEQNKPAFKKDKYYMFTDKE